MTSLQSIPNKTFKNPKKHVSEIVSLVTKEMKKYPTPSVTMVSWQKDPYKVLISCLLSLRTRDSTTIAASNRLFAVADTPRKMLQLSLSEVEKLIFPVGFYRTKAGRIQEINKILIEKYKSKVPATMGGLLELKGVGRKTAGITLVYGYGLRDVAIPADVHVHRTANRIGFVRTKTPEATEQELMRLVPKELWWEYNNTFVGFGQNVCKPVTPQCGKCWIAGYCRFFHKKVMPSLLKKEKNFEKKVWVLKEGIEQR